MNNISDHHSFVCNCSYCQQSLEVTDALIGQKFSCPACGKEISIPSPSRLPPRLPPNFAEPQSILYEGANKSHVKIKLVLIEWTVGILIFLIALLFVKSCLPVAVIIAAAATFLIPPIRVYAYSQTKIKIPKILRFIIVAGMFFFGIFIFAKFKTNTLARIERERVKEVESRAKELEKQHTAYFYDNRKEIIANIRSSLEGRNWNEVVSISKDYLHINDRELKELNSIAIEKIKEIEIERKALAKAEKEKREAEERRDKSIKSQFSGWDGSHYALTRYLKQHMKDPDSYEHVETKFTDKGDYILVITTYRGKNSFGALVINTIMAKVDLSGNITEVIQ